MPELEYILMKKTGQNYRLCRQLVLDSRVTLGLGKYDLWTENLHDAAMRLYVARYGPLPHKVDADSTTISSYSLDDSEEIHQTHRKMATMELKDDEDSDESIPAPEERPGDIKKAKKRTMKYKRLLARMRRALLLGAMRPNGGDQPAIEQYYSQK